MSDALSERILTTRKGHGFADRIRYDPIAPLECADGFTMSVQASRHHYCTPRDDDGPWSHFEIGFPSSREESIIEFAEEPSNPTDTVYGYVPRHIIEAIIAAHGGLKP